ncbi:uncharacterized protein LOC127123473 [Lathyrus oleraceus]|uniref:uncharacterized protein LOC127123473 n=1 Tax=Pisum sativum TaxID=3888 RepID=UPI0021D025AE|nr:uncharacterized protein LOC127123473 [Pisum sativum]
MKEYSVTCLSENKDVGWSTKDSEGALREIIIMWRIGVVSPLFSFRMEGSLGVCAQFKGQIFYFVNVYSSRLLERKIILWSELEKLKNSFGFGWWSVGGDFNTIREKVERVGRNIKIRAINMNEFHEFNELIDYMELVDIPSIENVFTWSNKKGSARRSLDRFLLSESFTGCWKIIGQTVGDKDISDHSPIWIKANDMDWEPKPFRVNSCWFENKDFKVFVEDIWRSSVMEGKQAYIMKEKFKILRNKMRVWNKECFGWLDLKMEEAV